MLSAGEVVTKLELMDRIWPGAVVEENRLHVHIAAVRKALGPDRGILKTASGRGYRLLGTWTVRQERAATKPIDLEPTATAVQPFPTNLPAAASDLIGRGNAARQLRDLLSAHRVLTGPGGIGKTVLAIEVAHSLPAVHPDGRWLVELASLADPTLVPSAVAHVLGLKLGGDEISAAAVARAIGTRKLLLVLDNCEHVIDAVSRLAETIVRGCPHVTVVATSREVLRTEGEYVYRVTPLDVPPPHQQEPEIVLKHSAVQLLIARITASHSEFPAHQAGLAAIAAICRQLDGIPLAIEFAAARAATLGLQQVACRLDDRFGLLTGGRRTALPRHQTLRATLDWSYELLPRSEQRLLRHVAAFHGGFTLDAAIAIIGDGANAELAVIEDIANLVSKSLVTLEGSTSGRWRLLETIRAYALEKLAENGETERAARSHAEFFRDFVAPACAGCHAPPAIADMAHYAREIDNVRAALDWAFSAGGDVEIGIVLTASYAAVWLRLALMIECRERTERALDKLDVTSMPDPRLRMQLQIALGVARIFTIGSVEKTAGVLVKALEVADELDDPDAQLRILWAQWTLYFNIGECHVAQFVAEQFSRVARRTGDPAVALVADRLTGNTLQYAGKPREAIHYFERVLKRYVAPIDQRHTTWFHYDQRVLARSMLARALWLQGLVDQAADQAMISLDEARASAHELSLLYPLAWAVYPINFMIGDVAAAEQAMTTLSELAASYNATFWKILAHCLEGKLQIERGEFVKGSARLRAALDICDSSGWTICYPEFLGLLAKAQAGLGQLTEALVTIDQALATAHRGGERWYVAELLRSKGELLLQQAQDRSVSAAENCFGWALEVARQQEALFWELRGAMSLAQLKIKQRNPNGARQVLAPVYDRFTEGFATADLRSAKALLESLGPVD